MLWLAPRQEGSGWSRANKQRAKRMIASGLMMEAGLAADNIRANQRPR